MSSTISFAVCFWPLDLVRERQGRCGKLALIRKREVRPVPDDDVVKVLARELKKRKEAATAFTDAGQADRADAELAEAQILQRYLPAQMSDEEIADVVTSAITELGASGPQAMGQVMKTVQPKVAGRADGGRVAAEVKRQLAD